MKSYTVYSMPKSTKIVRGFTLIELLVVIGILAVLLTITLIAINPARQFAQSNNTKRRSDILTILNAVGQYSADHKGLLPTGITSTATEVANTGADICNVIVPDYVSALPVDPQTGTGAPITDCAVAYATGYEIMVSTASSRITVQAPGAELSDVISVTR
jgi:prepilin-type N-terminal cleavage/methylation domain-containing protein